jgi:hypothetical protein
MFVSYILKKISTTYRTFLFVLIASLLSMSFVGLEKQRHTSEKEQIEKENTENKAPINEGVSIHKVSNQAVVPAVKLDIQKVAILFREILLDEINAIHPLHEQKIILPKLLQTLLTTAIQKNAP